MMNTESSFPAAFVMMLAKLLAKKGKYLSKRQILILLCYSFYFGMSDVIRKSIAFRIATGVM